MKKLTRYETEKLCEMMNDLIRDIVVKTRLINNYFKMPEENVDELRMMIAENIIKNVKKDDFPKEIKALIKELFDIK